MLPTLGQVARAAPAQLLAALGLDCAAWRALASLRTAWLGAAAVRGLPGVRALALHLPGDSTPAQEVADAAAALDAYCGTVAAAGQAVSTSTPVGPVTVGAQGVSWLVLAGVAVGALAVGAWWGTSAANKRWSKRDTAARNARIARCAARCAENG